MSTSFFIQEPKRLGRRRQGPLALHMDAFSTRLVREGHSKPSAWYNIKIVRDFDRWLSQKEIVAERIDEETIDQYMRFRARHRHLTSGDRPALNRLLAVLREAEVVAPRRSASPGPQEQIVEKFQHHASTCGGYARKSIMSHLPTLRRFLSECCPDGARSFRTLAAADVTEFVRRHAKKQCTESIKHMCWTLRSFLRFLRYEDLIATDLAATVPPVRTWRFSSLPQYLTPEQVEKVLAAVDRTTRLGRRDYAVLLLLARLGLRASEVATLCIGGRVSLRFAGRAASVHGCRCPLGSVPRSRTIFSMIDRAPRAGESFCVNWHRILDSPTARA